MRAVASGALAVLVALSARAEEPQLDLAPLVPPAPWLKKNQKKKPLEAKKKPKKKGAPKQQAVEVKPGGPAIASPPSAPPPLALPLPLPETKPVEPPALAKPNAVEPLPEPAEPPAAVAAPPPPPAAVAATPSPAAKAPELSIAPLVPAPNQVPREAVATTAPSRAKWTRPAGMAMLAAGGVALAAGAVFGAKSHSDLNAAESSFHQNGGVYRAGDLSNLSSGNSAARTANALFIASAALAAAGAVFTFAF